jgi:hypothetical protein
VTADAPFDPVFHVVARDLAPVRISCPPHRSRALRVTLN